MSLQLFEAVSANATREAAQSVIEAAFLPVQSPTEGHLLWEIRRNGGCCVD